MSSHCTASETGTCINAGRVLHPNLHHVSAARQRNHTTRTCLLIAARSKAAVCAASETAFCDESSGLYHPAIQRVNPGVQRLSTAGVHWLPAERSLAQLTSLQLCNLPVEAHRWHVDVVLPAICSMPLLLLHWPAAVQSRTLGQLHSTGCCQAACPLVRGSAVSLLCR